MLRINALLEDFEEDLEGLFCLVAYEGHHKDKRYLLKSKDYFQKYKEMLQWVTLPVQVDRAVDYLELVCSDNDPDLIKGWALDGLAWLHITSETLNSEHPYAHFENYV